MYYDFTVEIPQIRGKIYRNTIRGVVYINYEYDRVYKPDKRYNIPKRTTIGKVCEEDPARMYPNPNYLKFFPEAELPTDQATAKRSSCLRIGANLVIQKIIRDYKLDQMLEQIIGRDSGLFLDLAAYSIITEGNAGQYYPEYAYNHPLLTSNMHIYSDSKVSDFLASLSLDQSVAFQNEWNSTRDHRKRVYISYDSTNKACQAGDIELAEFGYAKQGHGKEVFNVALPYDSKNREPLFYEEYPGSIVDVSQLQYMLEKAQGYGYRRAGFILDRGYFCKENIHYMDKCGYDFVIMLKGQKALVKDIILQNKGSFEENRACSIRSYGVSGKTIKRKLFESDQKERYFHLYYDDSKRAADRERLESAIDREAEFLKKREGQATPNLDAFKKHFNLIYYHEGQADQTFVMAEELTDVINEEIRLCGYFCLVTSEKMTAKEALELYKGRDASEKLFRADKSYLGHHAMRVHSTESLRAKTFVEFVAIIIRNKIYTSLLDAVTANEKRANFMNVPAAMRELEKIEMVRLPDGKYRLDHAVSARQKTILKAFDMDARTVKIEADKISAILSQAGDK